MGLAERRQRERDRRQDDIINTANRLFFQKGFEGVSMGEIANEVELGKSTLYFYFKDKESLYFAIVNRGIKIFRLIIFEETKRCVQTDGLEVGVVHRAFNRFIQEHPDYAQAYINFRSGQFKLNNKEDINTDAKEIIEFTEELIKRAMLETKTGIETRIFRSDVNPAILTAFNFLMNESILTMTKDLKNMLEAHGITMLQFYLAIANLSSPVVMHKQQ